MGIFQALQLMLQFGAFLIALLSLIATLFKKKE